MLIASARYSQQDAERWRLLERQDALHAESSAFARNVGRAEAALAEFLGGGDAYAGVSWGKDSVVIAEMVNRLHPHVPLVWVRVEPFSNPDCLLVRDAFLAGRPDANYHEITMHVAPGPRPGRGILDDGFSTAQTRFSTRYISGVRGEESQARKLRMMRHGESTASTCAPIGWWRTRDVWAYLYSRQLPVCPAYACMGVEWDRDRIRVATIGGERGTGHGRAEWERRYYPEVSRLTDKST